MKQYVIHIPSSKISVKNSQEVIDSAKEIGKIDAELWEGQHRDGAFRKMYETIGFKRIVWFTRLPIVKQIVDFGYHIFAYYIRPWLPKKKKTRT